MFVRVTNTGDELDSNLYEVPGTEPVSLWQPSLLLYFGVPISANVSLVRLSDGQELVSALSLLAQGVTNQTVLSLRMHSE
jgi:hypothetical protein